MCEARLLTQSLGVRREDRAPAASVVEVMEMVIPLRVGSSQDMHHFANRETKTELPLYEAVHAVEYGSQWSRSELERGATEERVVG
jgi:hypothetical protein